jgi:hypothetical protein
MANMTPDGPASHEIRGTTSTGQDTLLAVLSDSFQKGQVLDIQFAQPFPRVRYVRVVTTASVSPVSWYEIQVWAAPAESWLSVDNVKNCGVATEISVPVHVKNRSAIPVDIRVDCIVAGTLADVIRLYGVAPGQERDSGFIATCDPDDKQNVLCEMTAVSSSSPESTVATMVTNSTLECSLVCCDKLFIATPSTARNAGLPDGQAVDFRRADISTNRRSGDRFFLRGSCGSSGSWVADDVVTVGDFGVQGNLGDKGSGFPIGVPVEGILYPVGVTEITNLISMGESFTRFLLRDLHAPIFGNTEIYLVKISDQPVTAIHDDTSGDTAGRIALVRNPSLRRLEFVLPTSDQPSGWRVTVFNISGQEVTDLGQAESHARVVWEGQDYVGSRAHTGVYFIVAKDGRHTLSRKALLIN